MLCWEDGLDSETKARGQTFESGVLLVKWCVISETEANLVADAFPGVCWLKVS